MGNYRSRFLLWIDVCRVLQMANDRVNGQDGVQDSAEEDGRGSQDKKQVGNQPGQGKRARDEVTSAR